MNQTAAPAAPKESLESLLKKRQRLQASIDKENDKETARFAKVGWGYGMRHSKLPNSSKRSDELEYRMRKLERLIAQYA